MRMLSGNGFYSAIGAGSHKQLRSLSWFVSGVSGLQRDTRVSMESLRYGGAHLNLVKSR